MKITLRTAHTHNGIDYKAGDTIDVSEADAAWIEANSPAVEPTSPKLVEPSILPARFLKTV